jgi:hypothetical protein
MVLTFGLAQRGALQRNAVRAVHDAVQDRVGHGGIFQPGVPGLHGQLAHDQRGLGPHPVVQQFQQVGAFMPTNFAAYLTGFVLCENERVRVVAASFMRPVAA